MRRAIWLGAGAALGIIGYRRADRAVRSIAGTGQVRSPATPLPTVPQASGPSPAGLAIGLAAWTAARVRARRAAGRPPAAAISAFIGDVRAGMAEYLDGQQAQINRQHARSGNTLIDQCAPGQAAPRESARPRLGIPGRVQEPETDKTKDGR
ncbi:MAG TPA: hypothetical protein VMR14_07960 [Streptosporangiaceae bacterium]|nr:hypothetical protein [Streptosporangiaceae bacterium]